MPTIYEKCKKCPIWDLWIILKIQIFSRKQTYCEWGVAAHHTATQLKTQHLHIKFHANYFLLPKIPEEIADDHCSSITKGSTYHIKHMSIEPFTVGVDRAEIWHLMEVSTMFYICRYCVFTQYGRTLQKYLFLTKSLTVRALRVMSISCSYPRVYL